MEQTKNTVPVAVQLLLIKNQLPSNGHCSVVCFAAIA
jgi:hypothetical protein